MDLYLMRDIELQLRQAAEEIRRKHYPGWGNVCEQAADALANALDDLAAERARAESLHQRLAALEAERDELVRFKEDAILACAKHRCSKWEAALMDAEARAERAEARLVALEDEKNTYIDYVGDALGQDHDGESLWDAAQRVLSDRDRPRAAIEQAPHAWNCTYVLDSGTIIRYGVAPCNCWKADALRAAGGE